MTNFEKLKVDIQGMSLNQFLRVCRNLVNFDCKYCIWKNESCGASCLVGRKKWLESEVEK